ncbi:T9SS type A sorting domain-containing protein [Winogradskyella rapida]|uniref:T9SS type A sorting domain-containing protein n=1 Tax=Winogradskyella rapida TaxID=549701 RepID=A0ABW3KWI7_9FLAO
MTKKLLLIVALSLGYFVSAQTDEAIDATPINASVNFNCENEKTGNFAGFTKSEEFTCLSSEYDEWIDVWYSFTPTETQTYAIETEALNGSTYDVRIAIFTGTPGNLTTTSGCSTRYSNMTLNSGETYYIHLRGAFENTQYRLCVYPFPEAPINDEPLNADRLEESTFEVCEYPSLGYTTSATYSSETICSTSNPDVWYKFTPSETAEYTFKTTLVNGSTPTYIGIYSGTPGYLNALSEDYPSPTVQCQDIVLANLNAEETYYIGVTSSQSSQAIYFELCAYKSPPAPTNDSCATPIALTVGQSFEDNYIIATNTSATVDAYESNYPSCGTLDFTTRGRDVWFTVVVPASGNFTVETRLEPTETNISDTVMEMYTGSCGAETLEPYYYNLPPPNTTTAYCNDQFVIGGDQLAGVLFTDKTPGETVYIRVWGWALQFGKFRISAYDASTLGVQDFDESQFSFHPNPVNEVLNLNYHEPIETVTVNNLLGKAVLTKTINATSTSVDFSNLASGIYIVTVNSGKATKNFKVIKQ